MIPKFTVVFCVTKPCLGGAARPPSFGRRQAELWHQESVPHFVGRFLVQADCMVFTDPFLHVSAECELAMSNLSNGVQFVMDEALKSAVSHGGGVSKPEHSGMF